ncbi:MetS family NSS transporter small subunit [Actinomyces sp. zg-332]|nr:MetS family NSS transporter small subunit [Actinomyces sp. zg-332]QPK94478.1 MetS family NSS transporter small subunit [Actinomyces sp. zg-332]
MSISAITMLIVSCALVWGGLVVSVIVMNKLKAPWQLKDIDSSQTEESL